MGLPACLLSVSSRVRRTVGFPCGASPLASLLPSQPPLVFIFTFSCLTHSPSPCSVRSLLLVWRLPSLPLIVGGVPRTGAKSRVETQIKIRLALALPNPPGGLLNSFPTPSSSAASDASADDESHLAFVSTYTHVKLQKGTATKRKSRRAAGDSSGLPKPEQTLYLETEVYCATEGVSAEEFAAFEDGSAERKEGLRVYACQGCRTREVRSPFFLSLPLAPSRTRSSSVAEKNAPVRLCPAPVRC